MNKQITINAQDGISITLANLPRFNKRLQQALKEAGVDMSYSAAGQLFAKACGKKNVHELQSLLEKKKSLTNVNESVNLNTENLKLFKQSLMQYTQDITSKVVYFELSVDPLVSRKSGNLVLNIMFVTFRVYKYKIHISNFQIENIFGDLNVVFLEELKSGISSLFEKYIGNGGFDEKLEQLEFLYNDLLEKEHLYSANENIKKVSVNRRNYLFNQSYLLVDREAYKTHKNDWFVGFLDGLGTYEMYRQHMLKSCVIRDIKKEFIYGEFEKMEDALKELNKPGNDLIAISLLESLPAKSPCEDVEYIASFFFSKDHFAIKNDNENSFFVDEVLQKKNDIKGLMNSEKYKKFMLAVEKLLKG